METVFIIYSVFSLFVYYFLLDLSYDLWVPFLILFKIFFPVFKILIGHAV